MRFLPSLPALLCLSLGPTVILGQTAPLPPVVSGVFTWAGSPAQPTAGGTVRSILAGETLDLAALRVDGVMLHAGAAQEHVASAGSEVLVIVRDGELAADLGAEPRRLTAGGVAYVLAGDTLRLRASTTGPAEYYIFRYTTRAPGDAARGASAGGSFLLPWEEVTFVPSPRGGHRQQCRRATALFELFEMHTTTLRPGLFNHEVHTHRAEEMAMLRQGTVEMQIDGHTVRAGPGDLLFLRDQVPHGRLAPQGDVAAEYFAFQWR